ncbi:MAG: DUF5103 domain-containing protein [Candidatus Symbiothrix sp.]|jgi:hypothetical protein|nr:DUF5103 domain-containing protein [Candidatus Symbiothrix sp.]
MRKIIIAGFWLFTIQLSIKAQIFRTQALSERVQTLLVHSSASWDADPIIGWDDGGQIEINFDVLGLSTERYTYLITHCNADWKPSQLVYSEYLSGLQNNYLDDYAHSFNTKMDYVNYRLFIPNEQVQLKLSGNYAVQILDEDATPVLNACFSIVEPLADIEIKVSSVTDKGVNSQYQAVSFEIFYGNEVKSPLQDLKVYVRQNRRFDNEAALLKPLNVQNGKAFYDHRPDLIFPAGNEYRAFEMITTHYNGLGVESVEYHAPYYHTVLKPGAFRNNRYYSYNEDLNGRIYIRNLESDNPETEADYELVHFYLPCDTPFPENVYILSDAFHNLPDARSQMDYSPLDKAYIKTALLKEGYYNYLYVTGKDHFSPASTALIEGNYYETENEYRVLVYFRPMGERYDRLIGVKSIQYR